MGCSWRRSDQPLTGRQRAAQAAPGGGRRWLPRLQLLSMRRLHSRTCSWLAASARPHAPKAPPARAAPNAPATTAHAAAAPAAIAARLLRRPTLITCPMGWLWARAVRATLRWDSASFVTERAGVQWLSLVYAYEAGTLALITTRCGPEAGWVSSGSGRRAGPAPCDLSGHVAAQGTRHAGARRWQRAASGPATVRAAPALLPLAYTFS